ncbi:electron transfer flavoprotein subunit alpha [Flavobacteriaceae bacterium UJ101]|nr:electron transfer flavoprotein subunit alpha [Flavobacteriaceae bacterium UJ101]
MSIIAFVDSYQKKIKKSAFEVVSYAKNIADQSGKGLKVVAFNVDDVSELEKYGATDIIKVNDAQLDAFSAKTYAEALLSVTEGSIYVLSHSNMGSSIGAFLSIKKQATLITNVLSIPSSMSPFTVKRKSFSGKGIMEVTAATDQIVVTVMPNSFGAQEAAGTGSISEASATTSGNTITVNSIAETSGKVSLKEADIVVSGGRGLKGPENWGMVEELADLLGAATACSKPVADIGWRPHSEHVGQTGIALAPNLYIAIGISGAIQHLAGVNASKKILVINNDPEAPFFKAADYGVCGDAFEVVPALIEKIKAAKA